MPASDCYCTQRDETLRSMRFWIDFDRPGRKSMPVEVDPEAHRAQRFVPLGAIAIARGHPVSTRTVVESASPTEADEPQGFTLQQPSGHTARTNATRLLLALLLLQVSGVTIGDDIPALPASDADEVVPEIVVEAPEPRYVAPTLRDRIGRIWAPVRINGRGPFRLVVDTGWNRSAVTTSVVEALGIVPTAGDTVVMHGVTGTRTVPVIAVDSLVVGDLELYSKRLPVMNDALGGADGVLGTEGLLEMRIYIDFRHDLIRISRSRMQQAAPNFLVIPVKIVKGLLLVANVRIGTLRAKAIIDTGGHTTLANTALRDALARKIRPEDILANEIIGTTLDVQRGDLVVTPNIAIGSLEIKDAYITAGDMHIFQYWKMTQDPALLIGMDVLGQFDTLIIDYARRELQVRLRSRRASGPRAN